MVAQYASQDFRNAEKLEKRPSFDPSDAFHKVREAEYAREEGGRSSRRPRTSRATPAPRLCLHRIQMLTSRTRGGPL